MKLPRIIAGILVVMVGLGLVCPQLATLRMGEALFAGQIMLLGAGVLLTAAGAFVFGQAARSR